MFAGVSGSGKSSLVFDTVAAAIVVDQSALVANVRSTVGTATDVTPLLRVLFSRIAEPHAGGPGAYSFNVPSVSGGGVVTDATGTKTVRKNYTRTGGMCPSGAGTLRLTGRARHSPATKLSA